MRICRAFVFIAALACGSAGQEGREVGNLGISVRDAELVGSIELFVDGVLSDATDGTYVPCNEGGGFPLLAGSHWSVSAQSQTGWEWDLEVESAGDQCREVELSIASSSSSVLAKMSDRAEHLPAEVWVNGKLRGVVRRTTSFEEAMELAIRVDDYPRWPALIERMAEMALEGKVALVPLSMGLNHIEEHRATGEVVESYKRLFERAVGLDYDW